MTGENKCAKREYDRGSEQQLAPGVHRFYYPAAALESIKQRLLANRNKLGQLCPNKEATSAAQKVCIYILSVFALRLLKRRRALAPLRPEERESTLRERLNFCNMPTSFVFPFLSN